MCVVEHRDSRCSLWFRLVDMSPCAVGQAPSFLTIQVSRNVLNEAIRKLNAYAAPRVETPSELLLTADEITSIIDQGKLSRISLLSVAHLKRIEVSPAESASNMICNARTALGA